MNRIMMNIIFFCRLRSNCQTSHKWTHNHNGMYERTDGRTYEQTDGQTDKFWSLGTLLRLTDFLCHGLSNKCCKRFNVAMRNKRRRDSQRLDGTKASHTAVYIIEI